MKVTRGHDERVYTFLQNLFMHLPDWRFLLEDQLRMHLFLPCRIRLTTAIPSVSPKTHEIFVCISDKPPEPTIEYVGDTMRVQNATISMVPSSQWYVCVEDTNGKKIGEFLCSYERKNPSPALVSCIHAYYNQLMAQKR